MFTIQSENLQLELEILPVASLFAHERFLAPIADRLSLEFRSAPYLENPVIVDANLIVLDGNHRVHVFRRLQFKHIAVCRIDYTHKEARLRYWFRLLANVKSIDLLKRISEEFGGRFEYVRDKAALERIMAENFACCGVQRGDVFGVLVFDQGVVEDAVSAYDLLEKLQARLVEEGIAVEYIPCQYAHKGEFCQCLTDEHVILWTPQITKEMVVEAAKQERLFAPKTTRHLIPARPLQINVPTAWLREEVSLEVINQRFMEHLRAKDLKRLPPGQVINGRYYEEELFVFYDRKPSSFKE
jgi:L-serine kinase (ADP)